AEELVSGWRHPGAASTQECVRDPGAAGCKRDRPTGADDRLAQQYAPRLRQLHDRVPAGDPQSPTVAEQVDDGRAQVIAADDGAAGWIDVVDEIDARLLRLALRIDVRPTNPYRRRGCGQRGAECVLAADDTHNPARTRIDFENARVAAVAALAGQPQRAKRRHHSQRVKGHVK